MNLINKCEYFLANQVRNKKGNWQRLSNHLQVCSRTVYTDPRGWSELWSTNVRIHQQICVFQILGTRQIHTNVE